MSAVTFVDVAHMSMSDPSLSLQFETISLRDPGNDNELSMRDYIVVSPRSQQQPHDYDIYEIQTALPHTGKFASHFVGSRIISNPLMHVTTRVDPLFFVLAHLQRVIAAKQSGDAGQLEKWQPIQSSELLGDIPSTILRALHLPTSLAFNGINQVGQLEHLLDVSDMCGDDLILCKFSEERTLKWLVAKFERSAETLRMRLREKKRRASEKANDGQILPDGSGALSSSFRLAEKEGQNVAASRRSECEKELNGEEREVTSSDLSKEEEKSVNVGALQLVCDYIPTEWKDKLSREVGLTHGDWIGKKKPKSSVTNDGPGKTVMTGEKRARSSWEGNIGQEDADALLRYTTGSNGLKVITPSGTKETCNAKSIGLKRLAKVNTKGMKSMTSFFGKKRSHD